MQYPVTFRQQTIVDSSPNSRLTKDARHGSNYQRRMTVNVKQATTSNLSVKRSGSETTNNTAAENFLLKVRINALKNKIGFRGLTMEQRSELEEKI